MAGDKVLLLAVGDVIPEWPRPEDLFEAVLPTLKPADIRFGQLEANLSEKGDLQLFINTFRKVSPTRVTGLTYAGFDIMSFASNHTLDRGEAALFETIDTLTANNIRVLGVGRNIEEARRPVIFDRKGFKVAFLGYCSVLPKGYDARPDKSGAAPMRATTFYEQVDWQPGTPPRIVTLANKDDLDALVADVKKVRRLADVVVLSMHWGVHFVPSVIAMYQREVAHAAIDAGVDLIIGHHAHILKGIEVYKGKAIFYSLCNFAMPLPHKLKSEFKDFYGVPTDPDYPFYFFPVDSRNTIIAKAVIANKRIERVSFLPVRVNGQGIPNVQRRQDAGFNQVLDYMKLITANGGLNAEYRAEGDEVVVATA